MKIVCWLVLGVVIALCAGCAKSINEEYWITHDSGVIHNAKCQWFKQSRGRVVTGVDTGRNCRICGGSNNGSSQTR
jgi:hypothetical protein